jgi:uncharacterized protein (TIGR00106 family)
MESRISMDFCRKNSMFFLSSGCPEKVMRMARQTPGVFHIRIQIDAVCRHAFGTNIEGDWDSVFAAVKQCHEALHTAGVPRISTSMRFGTRIDREQTMEDKVRSVEEKLIP